MPTDVVTDGDGVRDMLCKACDIAKAEIHALTGQWVNAVGGVAKIRMLHRVAQQHWTINGNSASVVARC